MQTARIWVDGACRGNPGPASIGALIASPEGEVLMELSECLGTGTNNIAEYTALIRALEEAKALGIRRVEAHSDSQLLVRQMSGQYRVRHPGLQPLFAKALALSKAFEYFSFTHVPREENREADRLANEALDRG